MAKNLLRNLEVDEASLEEILFHTGEHPDWDVPGHELVGTKKLAIQHGKEQSVLELSRQNHFVKLNYVINNGQAFIYPSFNPSTELDVEIRGYKPVFGNRCSLVLGEHAKKQFVFFDPNQENKDHESLLSTKQKLKLGTISYAGAYSEMEPDLRDMFHSEEEYQQFLSQGYTTDKLLNGDWKFPLYRTIFEVKELKSRKDNHYIFSVKNPISPDKNMDLATASIDFEEPFNRIAADYYLIGRF